MRLRTDSRISSGDHSAELDSDRLDSCSGVLSGQLRDLKLWERCKRGVRLADLSRDAPLTLLRSAQFRGELYELLTRLWAQGLCQLS